MSTYINILSRNNIFIYEFAFCAKKQKRPRVGAFINGGDGGIRTLDTLLRRMTI